MPSCAHVAYYNLFAVLGSSHPPSPTKSTKGQQPRARFIRKAACAAVSLTGLVVTAPLLLGNNEVVAPAVAEETSRRSVASVAPAVADEDVVSKFDYIQFDVQLSEGESGSFIVEVRPDWAPIGASRFTTLSKAGFFKDCRFFRVLQGFVAQVSIISFADRGTFASSACFLHAQSRRARFDTEVFFFFFAKTASEGCQRLPALSALFTQQHSSICNETFNFGVAAWRPSCRGRLYNAHADFDFVFGWRCSSSVFMRRSRMTGQLCFIVLALAVSLAISLHNLIIWVWDTRNQKVGAFMIGRFESCGTSKLPFTEIRRICIVKHFSR